MNIDIQANYPTLMDMRVSREDAENTAKAFLDKAYGIKMKREVLCRVIQLSFTMIRDQLSIAEDWNTDQPRLIHVFYIYNDGFNDIDSVDAVDGSIHDVTHIGTVGGKISDLDCRRLLGF